MTEFRRGVPAYRPEATFIDPTDWCECASPDNEAWSDLCKTCKRLVEPPYFEETDGVGWPQ